MSITTLAIIALTITLLGLGAAVYGLYDALREYRFTQINPESLGKARCLYARSTLRSQSFRTIKLLALSGIAAVTLVNPMHRRGYNMVLLMTVIVLTSLDAIADRYVSHKIVAHIRDRYRNDNSDIPDL